MTLTVLTPPPAEPVGLAEAKAHLRVTFGEEDALIAGLITAARERVEAELGLCLVVTGLRETGFATPLQPDGSVELARGPLVGVDAAGRLDPGGGLTPIGVSAEPGSRPGRITLAQGAWTWPPVDRPPAPRLQVDYRAGFGPAAADVPETLRQAVLAMVAEAYERRDEPAATLAAAEPWLRSWRRPRL